MPCAFDPTRHRTDVLQRLVHRVVLTCVCECSRRRWCHDRLRRWQETVKADEMPWQQS